MRVGEGASRWKGGRADCSGNYSLWVGFHKKGETDFFRKKLQLNSRARASSNRDSGREILGRRRGAVNAERDRWLLLERDQRTASFKGPKPKGDRTCAPA